MQTKVGAVFNCLLLATDSPSKHYLKRKNHDARDNMREALICSALQIGKHWKLSRQEIEATLAVMPAFLDALIIEAEAVLNGKNERPSRISSTCSDL